MASQEQKDKKVAAAQKQVDVTQKKIDKAQTDVEKAAQAQRDAQATLDALKPELRARLRRLEYRKMEPVDGVEEPEDVNEDVSEQSNDDVSAPTDEVAFA